MCLSHPRGARQVVSWLSTTFCPLIVTGFQPCVLYIQFSVFVFSSKHINGPLIVTGFQPCVLLGDSGQVVNSLDFCLASLKSLGCFSFRCVLSSKWKEVTANFTLHFWRPIVRMCLVTSNNLLLVLQDAPPPQKSTSSQSSGQPKIDAETLFSYP